MTELKHILVLVMLYVPVIYATTCQSDMYNSSNIAETDAYSYTLFTSMNELYNVAIGSVTGDIYSLGIGNDGSQDYSVLKRETVDGATSWEYSYQDITPVDNSFGVDPTETYVFFTDRQASYCLLAQVYADNGAVYNYAQFSTLLSRQQFFKIHFDSAGSYVYLSLIDSGYNSHFCRRGVTGDTLTCYEFANSFAHRAMTQISDTEFFFQSRTTSHSNTPMENRYYKFGEASANWTNYID